MDSLLLATIGLPLQSLYLSSSASINSLLKRNVLLFLYSFR